MNNNNELKALIKTALIELFNEGVFLSQSEPEDDDPLMRFSDTLNAKACAVDISSIISPLSIMAMTGVRMGNRNGFIFDGVLSVLQNRDSYLSLPESLRFLVGRHVLLALAMVMLDPARAQRQHLNWFESLLPSGVTLSDYQEKLHKAVPSEALLEWLNVLLGLNSTNSFSCNP